MPILGESDVLKLIQAFTGRVSFLSPAQVSVSRTPAFSPKINSFVASDVTATSGGTKFSWTTQDADYVALSYHCPDPKTAGIVILEEGGPRICDNDDNAAINPTEHFNRSPNSSSTVGFGNFRSEDPIAIVVTITPFLRAQAYPQSSKSLTVTVDPYNPFPQGVSAETKNMTILYAANADGSSQFHQGSSLKIDWTDSYDKDCCANFYLVQGSANAPPKFRSQIVNQCLTPARRGSFTWKIPSKFSGFLFRIYASTPGGESSALGPPFSITAVAPE